MKQNFIVIKTTFSNENQAKKLAKNLIEKRLAACVQISKVESFFKWEEKIASEAEFLLEIKTKSSNFEVIKSEIESLSSYEIPQVFSQKIEQISEKFLNWINQEIL